MSTMGSWLQMPSGCLTWVKTLQTSEPVLMRNVRFSDPANHSMRTIKC